jgi:hypothetical protein
MIIIIIYKYGDEKFIIQIDVDAVKRCIKGFHIHKIAITNLALRDGSAVV